MHAPHVQALEPVKIKKKTRDILTSPMSQGHKKGKTKLCAGLQRNKGIINDKSTLLGQQCLFSKRNRGLLLVCGGILLPDFVADVLESPSLPRYP